MIEVKISYPFEKKSFKTLRAGQSVLMSGYIYTARDAAHKLLCEMLERGERLPFDIEGQVIYFAGPCPAKPGQIIGSCGPTTSGRMDKYSPLLLKNGLLGMIGKGNRSTEVIDAMTENSAVYFAALGGAGALIARCVRECEPIAFPELGAEAVTRLLVEDMPMVVAIDSVGNNVYDKQYRSVCV